MNNLGEQMDINIKEAADYEVPAPPSMMRMKENEAYGTFPNCHDMKSLLIGYIMERVYLYLSSPVKVCIGSTFPRLAFHFYL